MAPMAAGPGAQGASLSATSAAFEARKLLRGAPVGALATVMEGQPFASMVTPACTPELSILLLLSDLSEHTRHLRADARCSLLVCGAAREPNPQTAPRLTVTGRAEPAPEAGLKARYLAVHPYAALYAGFGDFHLWRVQVMSALYVGGFARAVRLRTTELMPDAQAVAAIAAAEADIIAHCNTDHPGTMARIAGGGSGWRLTAVDVDGCDLVLGEKRRRVDWQAPVRTADEVRRELIRLARRD
jgi:putative heme iron utilization protein